MYRAPVWTAFITPHLYTRGWIRQSTADPKVIILRELRRSVFAFEDYTPQVTPRGEHVLKFTTLLG